VIKFERILSTAPFVHAPGGAHSPALFYFFQKKYKHFSFFEDIKNKGSILATKGEQQDFRYEWRN